MDGASQNLPEFFISRAGAHPADVAMAAAVGAILEGVGHGVFLQQWDFANRNFMERMDAALASGARVIAILTPQYLATDYCTAEWMHALDRDPLNKTARLIVLRAAECEPRGLLRTISYWDLVPILGRNDLLADIVKAAIMPDADRRHVGGIGAHWRQARPLVHDAIKPTASFTGREAELFKIDNALWSGMECAAAITQPAAVTGLGGIGKSTLAREYAWRAQEGYAGVWWLSAERAVDAVSWPGVEHGLVELGDKYIRGLAQAQDRAKAAEHTLDFLAHGGFSKPWLLIFDNVDDPRVLTMWRPRGNVRTLITSRIGNWSGGVAPIEVEEWALPEAIAYLKRETAREDSDQDFARLSEALGRLPLALSHAAAYLRRRKTVTISAYIADLDSHMRGLPKDAEYRSPVFATFRAALLQAEEEACGATALMSLAAFFAPDDIPEELFHQAADRYPPELAEVVSNKARVADALGALDDLSLVDFAPGSRTFSVHRIVQAAARDALAAERDAWSQHAVAVAFAAFPEPDFGTWPQCERLVAHARAVASHIPTEHATRELGWLLVAAGTYLRERAALADVMPLYMVSLAIRERLAKADPGNAGSQYDLGISNELIGDVQMAQGDLSAALKSYQAKNGIISRLAKSEPGNAGWQRDLSVSHNKIGDVFRAQGNLPAALDAYNADHAIADRLAKADPGNGGLQRDLSVSHDRIGDVLRAQGNLPAALDAFNASLAIRERLVKADPGNAGWQRDLSVSHNKIGDLLVEQGNLPAALDAYNASLAIRERLAKADSGNAGWQRDLSVSQEKVGDVLVEQGNHPAALDAYNVSLAIAERLAKADPGNAGWQADLAASYGKLGGLFLAMDRRQDALRTLIAGRALVAPLVAASPDLVLWQRYLREFDRLIAGLEQEG